MKPLHLSSLYIAGFRGIKEVSVPCLGRVTLLAGKNSSGKTTVLEAVRTFAAGGRESVLFPLLSRRQEYSTVIDEAADKVSVPDPAALFYGRAISTSSEIAIGPADRADERLAINVVPSDGVPITNKMLPQDPSDFLVLQTTYGGGKRTLPWFISREDGSVTIDRYIPPRYQRRVNRDDGLPKALECQLLGPGLVETEELAKWWDQVVLTDDENRAVQALKLVVGDTIQRVALVGGDGRVYAMAQRFLEVQRFIVKLRDHRDPVPLNSLGDGAVRLLGASISLATSKNGFLLIDEAENGLHHSVHYDYWRMVLQAAEENNVQIFATTHSFSCVRGFAKAVEASESESDNVLLRIERERGETKVVSYSEDELRVVADQGIEVR